jgi:hypothetical protein
MPFVKRSHSTSEVVPQQGFYTRLYGEPTTAAAAIFQDEEVFILDRGKLRPDLAIKGIGTS